MKLTNSAVPVYTVAGSSAASNIPEWLKNKKRKKGHDYANHIELLQDFEYEEASQCVRVSEDGDWVMSTGTYKPQIHTHYLPNLALSWARHTDTINKTFLFLSSDYSKSVHLQEDRSIEFHTPGGRHYSMRIPRYGRDLVYDKSSTELYVPSVGVNGNGMGEVFRINLELGRFMNEFEIDVGGDDPNSAGAGALQGGIGAGGINTGAVATDSHGLLAFGTTLGTIEYWDPRVRTRVATLMVPTEFGQRPEVTALDFHRSGIRNAVGTSSGLIYLYDLRSPMPTLKKDQGYDYPIQHVQFLTSSSTTRSSNLEPKILSADKRIIKIWEEQDGKPWTSVEPDVDINCVAWCQDSGMILTANEGKQQHAFLIPQLGPAPKWCAFLDNVVEEMADDPNDPNAFSSRKSGEVYDNFKFLTLPQLRSINLDHLVGKTNLLRPYMHGYFVAQRLYEEARLIANPTSYEEERAKRVHEKIEKERESRIRGQKKVTAKVNRKLAEKILEREALNERRRAQKVLAQGGDERAPILEDAARKAEENGLLGDSRFAKMFEQDDFVVDEESRAFQEINPSTQVAPRSNLDLERGLTAVEEEAVDELPNSSDEGSESEDQSYAKSRNSRTDRISTADYKRQPDKRKNKQKSNGIQMEVSSSANAGRKQGGRQQQDRSFGNRAATFKSSGRERRSGGAGVVGERTITFDPTSKRRPQQQRDRGEATQHRNNDRRSASNNTFRRM